MARFFISEQSVTGDRVAVSGADVRHMTKVLRLGMGDTVSLITEQGRELTAKLEEVTSKEVLCRVISIKEVTTEPPVKITLYQGMPKGDKMEMVIQKGTELGVSAFVPVICDRTVVHLEPKRALDRQVRWQRIAEEAAKQSRRTIIPTVSLPIDFKVAVANIKDDATAVMPWEQMSGEGLKHILCDRTIREVSIFIGPEGGFSENEASLAEKQGIKLVTLGPRILRTETAGLVTAAIILYELGDLGGVGIG